MKATELRIGNYFREKHSKRPIRVIGLELTNITFTGNFFDNWQAEPIPLTEEWLVKFGFYKVGKKTFYNLDIPVIPIRDYYRCKGKDIEYVHQLQNIFFALTGKELNLEYGKINE